VLGAFGLDLQLRTGLVSPDVASYMGGAVSECRPCEIIVIRYSWFYSSTGEHILEHDRFYSLDATYSELVTLPFSIQRAQKVWDQWQL
jgi:hypothetical protein